MSKDVFSPAVGAGLVAIAIASFAPFAALAQSTGSLIEAPKIEAPRTEEIAQMPEADNRALIVPDDTIVFSQTDRFAMRVYKPDTMILFNLYNKQTGVTEVLGAPAGIQSTQTGVIYRYTAREQTIEIAIANSGEQTVTINGTPQQASGTVSGTVFYLPRIALPPNAIVEVSLVDVSRADAPAITLSSMKMVANGRQVPLPFELLYDAGQIDSRYTYAVQSRITVDGDLQFINTTQFPVITNGNPTEGVEVQVDQVDQEQATTDQPSLIGTVWQLEQIRYNNDTQVVTDNPSNYTIEFMDDGQLAIGADCNQAMGSFTEDSSSLSVELGPTTLAACGPESVASDYLQGLQNAVIYFFQDGKLFIDLQADTGTMQFSPQE
ncbi:YbaY family lipoprotein [cf. Phormidesmis sp. LEGE 11477]|uniref:YbaY family lipoprotein n=1 Tax=cf. Phormidesmis sp. LEGE 11477 TaxID=1828680 RepID=UPI00187E5B52|nr:YbaY family lipoprotein [cf. Phormidesmis sp. LEGE 11477]MBE9060393.1 YbaY family lipoprotein [cf. Phormidesmis sp. LEGE 11477]